MKVLIFSIFMLFQAFCVGQITKNGKPLTEEEKKDVDTLVNPKIVLSETALLACKCIDSISTTNKTATENAGQVRNCIDKQVVGYQSTLKLSQLVYKKPKDSVTISVNVNPKSEEYKKYYYQIERELMESCTALEFVVGSNDEEKENSFSKNDEARDFYNIGVDFLKSKNYNEALPNFLKSVEIDPNFAFAWDNIGVCYRVLKNYDKAIDAYKKSIKIDPTGKTPLQNLALVYMFQKKFKKAIRAYKDLGKVDEENPEVFYGIGRAYVGLEKYEESLDNMCKAYNLYIEQNSPYRTDAEKIINVLYKQFKTDGKEKRFKEILDENNISY